MRTSRLSGLPRLPPPLPWARPRRELLLLTLVAVAALSPLYNTNTQDSSRTCLSRALLHGHLANDSCLRPTLDRAQYHGHLYTDKAPGLSVLEVPAVALTGLPALNYTYESGALWVVRLLSTGLTFLAAAFVIGRVSEGLAPGRGGAALVTFALGTLVMPFAASGFDHVPAGLLGLSAFLLAWNRRPVLAGLLGGATVFMEYESGLIVAVVALYVCAQGPRALARFTAGLIPGFALLGAYDWGAFGAPWRLSYRYVANGYAADQASGFFGIGRPHPYAAYEVLVGGRGLLVTSPVLLMALYGLWRMRMRYPLEVSAVALVAVLFALLEFGYFLPYGGISPGPRFFVPALPFLALGLGPAFARRPRATAVLAVASIVAMTASTLTWNRVHPRESIWGELARIPGSWGSSRFVEGVTDNVLIHARLSLLAATLVMLAFVAVATAVGLGELRPRRATPR